MRRGFNSSLPAQREDVGGRIRSSGWCDIRAFDRVMTSDLGRQRILLYEQGFLPSSSISIICSEIFLSHSPAIGGEIAPFSKSVAIWLIARDKLARESPSGRVSGIGSLHQMRLGEPTLRHLMKGCHPLFLGFVESVGKDDTPAAKRIPRRMTSASLP